LSPTTITVIMKISFQFRIKVSLSLCILCYTYINSQQQEALEVLYTNQLKSASICSLGGFCHYCCSCSEWRMFLRKVATPTVCMYVCDVRESWVGDWCEVLLVVSLRISCILSLGGGPFVRPF